MPENKDIKRALDELLGEELSADQLQNIQLFLKVATWNRIEDGRVTKTSPILPGKFCESTEIARSKRCRGNRSKWKGPVPAEGFPLP